ncbi:MAG: amidohydrolase family protein [Lachnospiraceae bacterium]|nr:amidohydrolase family protein [Lachnospiraceae bacterium]
MRDTTGKKGRTVFGECHAHAIMDGVNYKAAVALHETGVCETAVRRNLEAYRAAGVTFVRDGGDARGVSKRARELAPEYGIDYRTPIFAIHKRHHYGGIVGLPFDDWAEYEILVRRAKAEGADFIKIMVSGILDFARAGVLTEEGLDRESIRRMIDTAHDAGMAVMAHCNGDRTCFYTLEAGVDSLEHGFFMEDETLALLAERGTAWLPTFAPVANLLGHGRFPEAEVQKNLAMQAERVKKAAALGAHIGLGSDAGAWMVPHGQGTVDEYQELKKAGVSDQSIQETEEQVRSLFHR